MKHAVSAALAFAAFAASAAVHVFDFSGAEPEPLPVGASRAATAPAPDAAPFAVGDEVELSLFGDAAFSLSVVASPPAGIAGRSFIAKDAATGASAVLRRSKNGALSISIDDYASSRTFHVRQRGGVVEITERVKSADDARDECGTCAGGTPALPVVDAAPATAAKARTTPRLAASALGVAEGAFEYAAHKPVVDMMLVFDQGAKAWVEGTWADGDTIEEFAAFAVDKMNTVLVNSLVDGFTYRLVGVAEVDGEHRAITEDLLVDFRAGTGEFAAIPALREKCGADIASLIVDVDESGGSFTSGLGYGLGGIDDAALANFNNSRLNHNVCHIRRVWSRYTLSHETGHLMGCGHSDRLSKGAGPQSTPYSCGYNFIDAGGVRRYTVMAYNYTGDDPGNYYDPIPYFSTPDVTPAKYGVPLGDAEKHDNARVLCETHARVAEWREHAVPYDWDVKFLGADGDDIGAGLAFDGSASITLDCDLDGLDAIYYTLDGTEPTATSASCAPGTTIEIRETATLTACAVVGGVAQSLRTATFTANFAPVVAGGDGLEWKMTGEGPWTFADTQGWSNQTTRALHNYNFASSYGPDKTSALSAKVTGPGRFSFRHKSNFLPQSDGNGIFGRFSVVCDGGGAFTTTESSMTWRRDSVEIPEGTHTLSIVYQQGNSYSSFTDAGVWLEDLQLASNPAEVSISPRDVVSFKGTLTVTLAADRDGQTIRYTLDGSTPTAASPVYTGPVAISGNATIKAAAFDADGNAGCVAASNYIRTTDGINVDDRLGDGTRVWYASPQNRWGRSGTAYVLNYKFTGGPYHNSTYLGTEAEGPAILTFTYHTKFIEGSRFAVTIDGEEAFADTAGSASDTEAKVAIPEGTHDVRFVYSQSARISDYTDNHGVWLRSAAFEESVPLVWSGEAGGGGNGVWTDDANVLAWNGAAAGFANALSPSVEFGDLDGAAAPVVTVKGAVAPGVASFTAASGAYTFAKGDGDAKISLPGNVFEPSGAVAFKVPVEGAFASVATSAGKTVAFDAPFGSSASASAGTYSGALAIGEAGTLRISPGEGAVQTMTGTYRDAYYQASKLEFGEGKTVFTGTGTEKGIFGSVQLKVGKGAEVEFAGNDESGLNFTTGLTVEKGGTVLFSGSDIFHRTLNLDGGEVRIGGNNRYGRVFDFYYAPRINVTADSVLSSSSAKTATPKVFLRGGTPSFVFSNGATLTCDIIFADGTSAYSDATGGLSISGSGTFVQNSFAGEPLTYNGATTVGAGVTLVMNAAHQNAGAYSVEAGGTLVLSNSLETSALTMRGAALALANGASISVTGADAADIAGLSLSIDPAGYGDGSVLIRAAGGVSGADSISVSGIPYGREIRTDADGNLVLAVRSDALRVPGTSSAVICMDATLAAWLDADDGYANLVELNDGYAWDEYLSDDGANEYPNWMNFILGLKADDPASKIVPSIEVKGGEVVVSVARSIPDAPTVPGVKIVTTVYETDTLGDWPETGAAADGKAISIPVAAGGRFFKVAVSVADE